MEKIFYINNEEIEKIKKIEEVLGLITGLPLKMKHDIYYNFYFPQLQLLSNAGLKE